MQARTWFGLALAGLLSVPQVAPAQDSNIDLPAEALEERLRAAPFEVEAMTDTRFEGDRTQRVLLSFPDGHRPLAVKWARAAPGGETFNNVPRYELAAYELQKLFLDEKDYVVPPTVIRAVPLAWYRQHEPEAHPTFDGTESVLVVLQYWLFNVTSKDAYDRDRLRSDTAYARHFGDLNTFTYLIRHSDANAGNVLMSQDSGRPRLFSVDNGVSFRSQESDRGVEWRNLRMERLSRATVDRLRAIQREDLDRALSVLAQFEIRPDGQLVAVEPTEPLGNSGVRRKGTVVQLGLTSREIADVHSRLGGLLKRIDGGKIEVF